MQDLSSFQFEELLDKIQNEEYNELRDRFISKYTPFIIKTASNFINGYIEVENSEEYSISLMAFNEAIDRYDKEKGKFFSYAKLIINSRLKDYYKKKENMIESNDEEISEIEGNSGFIDDLANKEEIEEYEKVLNKYGLSFEILFNNSPTHFETRCRCLYIAREIVRNEFFVNFIKEKKRIPITKISNDFGVSKRVISYSKEYILSIVLIYVYEFDYLKNYIEELGGECNEKRKSNED